MKKNSNNSYLQYLPLLVCFIFIVCFIGFSEKISVQTILKYTPDNPIVAAIVLIFLYALKSVTVIFPIIILEVAGGHLFAPVPAIIINIIGIVVGYVITYWIGYFSGTTAIERLIKKYPPFKFLIEKQNNNSTFICFFLRTLSVLPGDVVSMYLGAVRTPFTRYLLVSALGTFPSTVLATLFGSSITEPSSPMFWISIVLMVLYSGVSFLIYKRKVSKV